MTENTREVDGRRYHEVRIGLPLPLDVVSTLNRLVGKAWPDTLMAGDGGRWSGERQMVLLVPEGDRPRSVRARDARPDEPTDALVDHVGPAGVGLSGSEHMEVIAHALLPHIAGAFAATPQAENYLESEVILRADESDARWVVIVARSEHQTPHALRTRAEQDADRARAAAAHARAQHDQLLDTMRAAVARVREGARAADALDDLDEATAHLRALTPPS